MVDCKQFCHSNSLTHRHYQYAYGVLDLGLQRGVSGAGVGVDSARATYALHTTVGALKLMVSMQSTPLCCVEREIKITHVHDGSVTKTKSYWVKFYSYNI